MKTTERRDVVAEVTNQILADLEAGVAPWIRPWAGGSPGVRPGMPSNFATGRGYRGANVLILWMQAAVRGYMDTRWLTYKQAAQLGGHVKKGEKGTKVVFWKAVTKDAEKEGEEKRRLLYAREYTVFNVEQCEGLDVTPIAPPPAPSEDEVLAMVTRLGVLVEHGGSEACYSPLLDRVRMPRLETFVDQGAYRSILLHETAHWTGHPSRLKRDLSGRFGSESYAFEELVAEMGSAFMCAALGVEGRLQHSQYIGDWIRVLKNDRFAVFTAARMAQEAMELVLGGAQSEEEDVAAAA